MSQSLLRTESDPRVSDSEFPPNEGPSFCSRPTPVTAVPAELVAALGGRAPDVSGVVARSARRTESAPPSSDGLEQAFFAGPRPSMPPSLPPPAPKRAVSRARAVASLLLFVTLFGGVAALLALALVRKLALDPGVLPWSVRALVAGML